VSLDPSLVGMDEVRGRDLYRRLLDRVRTLPGVEAASLASVVPFGDFSEGRQVQRVGAGHAGAPKPDEGGGPSVSYGAGSSAPSDRNGVGASYYIIGRDYFQALGIPILRGRGFTETEEQPSTGPRVAIVDEPLARRLFRGADPLGQYIYFPGLDEADSRPMEVVGIVGGTRHSLFDREPGPHVFVSFGQRYRGNMNLHIRTASSGPEADAAMLRILRQQVRSLDDRVPIIAATTMQEYRDRSMSAWIVRAGANLFSVFGGLAVFLAVVGVYGVRAYLVSRRTREIGIRVALGAAAGDVLWLVLREGLVLVAAGLAFGFLLAAGTGRLVSSLLYEVNAFDPLIFSVAPLLLAIAALLACYIPARRAAKVVPVTALRTE
jgi:predicted permease